MYRTSFVVLILSLPLAAQQPRPLPDQNAFLREVRKHLETDDQRQQGYTYVETRRQTKLDKSGRPQGESVKVMESYPGFPGEDRWERVISEDGKPTPAAELARQDRKRQEAAEAFVRAQSRQTASDRAKAAREREKDQRER